MTARKPYLEIGALFEEHWTGIPSVIAALAECALQDRGLDWSFVYETIDIPRAKVEELLARRTGSWALDDLLDIAWRQNEVPREVARQGVGLYPNLKPMQRFFGTEAAIVYDLSPLLTPQFHHHDTVGHFAPRIREDIEQSDHLFCISDATADDIHFYFKRARATMSVVRLGIDIDPDHVASGRIAGRGLVAEPYIAIIGTLEPRKNGGIILRHLIENPGLAARYRIVFIGRDGWLEERERLMGLVAQAGVGPDRVVFTGFVSERDKVALILNSRFCVYPSFYEGFGLPVLEAAALGKITVCSSSSSLPEVAPDRCVFFDPSNIHEFGEALTVAELRAHYDRSSRRSVSDIMADVRTCGWDACYGQMADWIRQQ